MSTPGETPRVKLFMSILFRGGPDSEDSDELCQARGMLQEVYGPVEFQSSLLPFDYTTYYQNEMGKPLWRRFLGFEGFVGGDRLVEVKWFCYQLERQFANGRGQRRLNLDPGLLSSDNLILATGKSAAHRVYLGRGIYADLTLVYRNGRFTHLPWTYPDYASDEFIEFLAGMRCGLLKALIGEA